MLLLCYLFMAYYYNSADNKCKNYYMKNYVGLGCSIY